MSNVVRMPDRSSARGAIAAEVRAEMARARLSGNKLPRLIGKSQSYWSRRLTGDQPFDTDDLEALAGLLGVPIVRFFAGTSTPAGPSGGAAWAPWGSNPQPTDCTSEHVTGDVVVGPWTGSGIVANEVVA